MKTLMKTFIDHLVIAFLFIIFPVVVQSCENLPLFMISDLHGRVLMYSNSGVYAPDLKSWSFNTLEENHTRSFSIDQVRVTSIDGDLVIKDNKLYIAPSELDLRGHKKYSDHSLPYDTKYGWYDLTEESMQYTADLVGYGCGGTTEKLMHKKHPNWVF